MEIGSSSIQNPKSKIQNPGVGRVSCPRCKANNFTGQILCWQCQAALPASAPQVSPINRVSPQSVGNQSQAGSQPQYNSYTGGKPSRITAPQSAVSVSKLPMPFIAALVAGTSLIAFLIVWIVAGKRNELAVTPRLPDNTTTVSSPASSLPDKPATSPSASEPDPVLEAGRRAVERETERLDLAPPVVSGDGRVHLRSGGSISPEEWRQAQRRVKDSPVMRQPPSPPPF